MHNLTAPSKAIAGYALAFTATLLWSGNFIAARFLADDLTPIETSFWRWSIACAALLPFTAKTIYAHRHLLRGSWPHIIVMAITSITLFNTFIYQAGRTTSATNMALLAATSPIVMAIMARVFLKEKLSRNQIVGIFVAMCGILVLISKGSLTTFVSMTFSKGDLWMMVAVLFFAAYSLQLRLRPKNFPQTAFFSLLVVIGLLCLVPAMVYTHMVSPRGLPHGQALPALLYIGVGAGVLAFLLWNAAIERIGMIRAGIIYYLIPLFSSIEAMILLDESMNLPQAVGGALILGGIFYSVLGEVLATRAVKFMR